MTRRSRLQAARHWIPIYKGKNLVRGYAKWFGVDLWCAVLELRMLGVEVDPAYSDEIWARQNKPKPRKSSATSDEIAATSPKGATRWK